jgi:hypothetical protein
MTGSLFLLAFVIVALLIVGILASPLFLIPAAVVLVVALFAGPVMAAIGGGRGASGVPDTDDAAYDPVQDPQPNPGR